MRQVRNVFETILKYGHDEDFAPVETDEFAPTDAPAGSRDKLEILAERIRSAVDRHNFTYKHQAIRVTVSLGFAVAEAKVMTTYDQMKHAAAAALSEAKTTGRNKSVIRAVPSRPEAGGGIEATDD